MMNKKAQAVIFIIVAIVIVTAFAIIFFFNRLPNSSLSYENEPQQFIGRCVRDNVNSKIELLSLQGGFLNPTDYKIYDNIKSTYLCKNINYYEPCITQYPLYISQIEEEIKQQVKPEVKNCFDNLADELKKRKYEVKISEFDLNVILKQGIVEIEVLNEISYSKEADSRKIENVKTSIKSPLYDLAYVANEIASQEARFCSFEYLGYMILYPKFDIRKNTMSDSTKIYTIIDKETGMKMQIAIRGCAIPPGG